MPTIIILPILLFCFFGFIVWMIKLKFKKINLWLISSGLTLLTFLTLVGTFVYLQARTPDFRTYECGSDKFYLAQDINFNDYKYIAKNGKKDDLSESKIADLMTYKDTYIAIYNEYFQDNEKLSFTQLLGCSNFNLSAIYQANTNDEKSRCYLLNRNNLTDYPECSKEIKNKFEMN